MPSCLDPRARRRLFTPPLILPAASALPAAIAPPGRHATPSSRVRPGRSSQEDAAISAMVADLVPGESPEGTARAICERVLGLPGIVFAALALFLPGDTLRSLAAVAADGGTIDLTDPSDGPAAYHRRARHLRELASRGPVIERCPPDDPSPLSATFDRLGITGLALAPLRSDGDPIGFLQVGVRGPAGAAVLEPILPTLGSFGVLASLLLGPELASRTRLAARHEAVQRIIGRRAFRSVVQPIVAISSGTVVGYEALTRFSDGRSPDEQFAEAREVGLGVELELATLEAAIAAAAGLPRDAWLDLNVSRALLEHPERLGYLLWKAHARSIVLEVTEHEAIGDYHRLRERVLELAIPVRLAVDDAGAGYASLRHILELRPDFIKLDRSLVADIDGDPVRQGLVAGLLHFASVADAAVIAEGIETAAECATLTSLGVDLGQGYLLGRPVPVGDARRRVPRPLLPTSIQLRPDDGAGGASRDAAHRVNAILWEADATDERMTFLSAGAATLTGHPLQRWLTEPGFWDDHVHPDDREAVLAAIADAIGDRHRVSLEYRFRMADGTYRWFEDLLEILPGEGDHTRLVGVMIDITERRRLAEQLIHRSSHDLLTGLLNGQGFEDVLARELPRSAGRVHAVLALDFDHFDVVTDGLGHRAGDEVLRTIADRIRDVTQACIAVCRSGGDAFAILAAADDRAAIVALAERVQAAVEAPSEVAGRVLAHPVSVGIAFVTPRDTADSAVRNARLAMHAAKRGGGDGIMTHTPQLQDAALVRLDAYAVRDRSA